MPFDEEIDARIQETVSAWKTTRRRMFGGTCYLLNGNMMCGVYKDCLFLRIGEERATEALEDPTVHAFDITGRPMKGWIMVDEDGQRDDLLRSWLEEARQFVLGLPPK